MILVMRCRVTRASVISGAAQVEVAVFEADVLGNRIAAALGTVEGDRVGFVDEGAAVVTTISISPVGSLGLVLPSFAGDHGALDGDDILIARKFSVADFVGLFVVGMEDELREAGAVA